MFVKAQVFRFCSIYPILRMALRASLLRAETWIKTDRGKKQLKNWLLLGTATAYPIGSLVANWPLAGILFPRRAGVTSDTIPANLEALIDSEYGALTGEAAKDTARTRAARKAKFYITEQFETLRCGSLSKVKAHIALPFYLMFDSVGAAKDYCKRNFADKLPILDGSRRVNVDWDSDVGETLAETMVLSDNAKRFVLRRDLYDRESYWAYINSAFTWASCSCIAGPIVYVLNDRSRILRQSPAAFAALYSTSMLIAYMLHREFFKFRDYVLRLESDSKAMNGGVDYVLGAREYYWKLLKRNRILRELVGNVDGIRLYTASGSPRSAFIDYSSRYAQAREADGGRADNDPEIGEFDDT